MTGIEPVRLPVVEWGERGRGRVLLIHGLSSSGHVWWRVADRLAAAGWIVSAPDLRGHGDAPRTESYALEGYVADLRSLGAGWDVVVGHSVGGAMALLASVPRGWARRLVLVDPLIRVAEDDHDAFTADLVAELDLDADRIEADHPGWHPEDVHLKVLSAARTSRHVVARTLADNRPWDVTAPLEEITVPVEILVANPELGGLLDPALAEGFARRNPWVSHRMLERCGHSIQREDPDAVVDAVGTPPG